MAELLKKNATTSVVDGRDALDLMVADIFPDSNIISITAPRRQCVESRISDSVLNEIIQQKIETKALPLTMRKRMMYQQSLGP